MSIAAAKKNAHIVEYVLYVWQMEDLVRAAQFSETAIEGLFNGEGGADCDWLLKLNTQMQREKLEEKGHISDVLEVQTELALLHDLLTGPMEDEIYVSAFQTAEPILQELEQNKMGEGMRHPTETMLTALYGWLVLKMRKEDVTLETQSPCNPSGKWRMRSRGATSKFTRGNKPQRRWSRRMWRLRLMAMRNTWDSFRSRSMTAVERASDDKAMELGGHNFKSASPTIMHRKYSCASAARLANALMVESPCISSSTMSHADWCLALA